MMYLGKSDLAKLFRSAYEATNPKSRIHHLAMLTQFWTGTRVSQLLDIRGEDVFQKDGRWVIMIRGAKRGNIVTQTVHVDAEAAFDMTPIIALAKTKGQSRIFGALSRQYYNGVLKKCAEKAGIHSVFAHSHIFRHSVAIQIFDATQRIGAVSQFLGHKSPASSMCYLAEVDGQIAQKAVDTLAFV